jgi:hypothetical protein
MEERSPARRLVLVALLLLASATFSGAQSPSTRESESTSVYRAILAESMAKALGAITFAQTDVEALAANTDYWAVFFRRFPSASAQVRLSPVAFDVVAREALVYCEDSVSPIVHLRQTNGMWTALAWHRVWIS